MSTDRRRDDRDKEFIPSAVHVTFHRSSYRRRVMPDSIVAVRQRGVRSARR